jgi:hypothetical protein
VAQKIMMESHSDFITISCMSYPRVHGGVGVNRQSYKNGVHTIITECCLFVLVVLGFELRALCLLGKHVAI